MPPETGSVARLGCAVLAVACVTGCTREPTVRELPTPFGGVHETWEEVFDEGREIALELPEDGPELLQVGKILRRSDGSLVVPDGRAKRILLFTPDGGLIREIRGGDGGAFPLSILRAVALGDDDDLFLFDPDGGTMTVLQAPGYEVDRRIQISTGLADLMVLPDGSSLSYSPTEEEVFRRFDAEGNPDGSAHRIRDENQRLFHARVQTGGITRTSGGEVVGIHPAAFSLVRMSPELDVLEVLSAPDHHRWQPNPPDFPEELSPYDYTPAHAAWWNTFDHIGTVHGLDRGLVLVTVFTSRGLEEATEFVNVYRLDDDPRLLAAGLPVPWRGRVVGASGNEVFVARNARLGEGESLEPFALYSYRVAPGFP